MKGYEERLTEMKGDEDFFERASPTDLCTVLSAVTCHCAQDFVLGIGPGH